MDLRDFAPVPTLVVKQTALLRPRFPVIDAHNHIGGDDDSEGSWFHRPVQELLDVLDESGVAVMVDLDGMWSEHLLNAHLDRFKQAAPERFVMFGGINWQAWSEQGNRFGEWAAARLRAQVARGAQGLKVWKDLGTQVCDDRGALVAVDDRRLDPLWATAGELNVPVMLHLADPVAFFDPLDARNERWEEMQAHPDWQFPSPPFPSFMSIIESMARVIERHPLTTFIGAHAGCYAENLGWVGALLDRCPNFYIDISARIAELGRQPYTARRFFLRYADRILFGLDQQPHAAWYRIYYRFLETDDENFNYGLSEIPAQGRWRIHGLYLPDDVLRRVYHRNAERVILRRT